jgi:hypothetical protein
MKDPVDQLPTLREHLKMADAQAALNVAEYLTLARKLPE